MQNALLVQQTDAAKALGPVRACEDLHAEGRVVCAEEVSLTSTYIRVGSFAFFQILLAPLLHFGLGEVAL